MEIAELLKSFAIEVWRYLSSRMISMRMALLLLLLVATAWCVSYPNGMLVSLADVVIVSLLLLEFRLWDDLCDVKYDRINHPERVLSHSRNLARFWWLLIVVATVAGSLVVWQRPRPSVLVLGVLHAVMVVWYPTPRRTNWKTVHYHIVLLKYPAFVFILANRFGETWDMFLPVAMVCSYLAMCVYEVWHDDHLRASRGPRALAAMETVLLFSVLVCCAGSELRAADTSEFSAKPFPISAWSLTRK